MSVDVEMSSPKVEMSKEEKKRRKEEKKAKKAAKAIAAEPAAPATSTSEEKKEKKDKKRKREEAAETTEATEEVKEKKEKQDKKDRKDKKEKKDKKDKKDKTAKAEAATSTSAPAAAAPASSEPAIKPSAFTATANEYLTKNSITLLPPLYPPHLSIQTLPVPAPLLSYLSKFTSPTPIQACSWPALLGGRDVVGIAETGSGKTLAFGVPALNHLSSRPVPSASGAKGKGKGKGSKGNITVLVLAPTRELAQQSHENLSLAGKSMGIESVCIFGGVPKDPQVRDINRSEVRIVVGTPGRTLDLANEGNLDLSQ